MSVHEEIREQQKKLKGKGFKAYWDYFWDYYKIHTAIALFVIVLGSMLIHDITHNKPYGFYAVLLNSQSSAAQDILEQGFTPLSGIDTDKESCVVDTSASFDMKIITETTIATSQKIMANIAGGDLDVIGADFDIFNYYSYQQVFYNLTEVLSAEDLEKYADKIVYVDQGYLDYMGSDDYQNYISTGEFDPNNKYAVMADAYNKDLIFPTTDKAEMDNPVPMGIRVDDSKILQNAAAYPASTPVVGVVINSKHPEIAVNFIKYLLEN